MEDRLQPAWASGLALGDEELDRQHADVARLTDAAVAACESGQRAELERAVAALSAAVQAHFAHEEQVMEATGFPDRARHREAHQLFLADAARMTRLLAAEGPSSEVCAWVTGQLPEWLRFHVLVNDELLVRHLATAARAGRRPKIGPQRRSG